MRQTASAATGTESIDFSKDLHYKKMTATEQQMFLKWRIKNPGGTTAEFIELREKAKAKANPETTNGTISHDGTFVTSISKEEARNLHDEARRFANETENG